MPPLSPTQAPEPGVDASRVACAWDRPIVSSNPATKIVAALIGNCLTNLARGFMLSPLWDKWLRLALCANARQHLPLQSITKNRRDVCLVSCDGSDSEALRRVPVIFAASRLSRRCCRNSPRCKYSKASTQRVSRSCTLVPGSRGFPHRCCRSPRPSAVQLHRCSKGADDTARVVKAVIEAAYAQAGREQRRIRLPIPTTPASPDRARRALLA